MCLCPSFTRPYAFDYKLLDLTLSRVSSIYDLGTTVYCQLIFKKQLEDVITKSNKTLGFILRALPDIRDLSCYGTLYCNLVRPILDYDMEFC